MCITFMLGVMCEMMCVALDVHHIHDVCDVCQMEIDVHHIQ